MDNTFNIAPPVADAPERWPEYTPGDDRRSGGDEGRRELWICAVFRDEARYLREWIEFHRLQGVSKFVLYNNLSTDGWQEVLQPYIDGRVVEVTEWTLTSRDWQTAAYTHCIQQHGSAPHWCAFIDCDEFLFSPGHDSLLQAVELVAGAAPSVGVNWLCFGGDGEVDSDLVVERFPKRLPADAPVNRHIKTIGRLDRLEAAGDNPHYFHVKATARVSGSGTVDERGRSIGTSTSDGRSRALTEQVSHEFLRINHYITKSRREWLRRHEGGSRRDATVADGRGRFEDYQTGLQADGAIGRFVAKLQERLRAAPACQRLEAGV